MSLRKYPPGITRVDSTGRAARLRRRRAEAAAETKAPPVGVVAAAIAERSTGKPLVVETLEQKLERLVPGALLQRFTWPRLTWAVVRPGVVARTEGNTPREAVARAIALWGGR